MSARGTYVRECDGREYRLTDEDLLWLARSLWGEVGISCRSKDASLVAWTMMNRFLLPVPQRNLKRWPTFAALIRGFSQPVNPDWLANGRFCRVGGKYANTEMCSFARISRRQRYQTTPLNGKDARIPHNPAMYAESFARGTLPRWFDAWGDNPGPEPFVDFASTPFAKHHGTDVGDGNYFFTKAQSKSSGLLSAFLPGAVVVVPAAATS